MKHAEVFTRHLGVVGVVACLAACAAAPLRVDSDRARLHLRSVSVGDIDHRVREGCEASLREALGRHGFVLDEAGPPLDVEVAFWDSSPLPTDGTEAGRGFLVTGRSPEGRTVADFTATVPGGEPSRRILATGSGGSARFACDRRTERRPDVRSERDGPG